MGLFLCLLEFLASGKGDGYRRAQQGLLKEGSRVATLVGWGNDGRHWMEKRL